MDKQEHIAYWVQSSLKDLNSMKNNFQSKNYDWALFIGHLALEKILKAAWLKNNDGNFPPKTHNLKKLADDSCVQLSENDILRLLEINDFNLETRYPDYKFEFYKKCTEEFTNNYITIITEIHTCIANQI